MWLGGMQQNLDPVNKELYPLHNKMGTYSAEFLTMDAGDYRPLIKDERTTLPEILIARTICKSSNQVYTKS